MSNIIGTLCRKYYLKQKPDIDQAFCWKRSPTSFPNILTQADQGEYASNLPLKDFFFKLASALCLFLISLAILYIANKAKLH